MLRLENKHCVVIGGGQVAARKVVRLVASGARVTVIAPTVEGEVQNLADQARIKIVRRPYRRGDLVGATLAYAATDSRTVNAAVADEANELGLLANVADDPATSTVHVPAVLEHSGLTLAISTGGRSPAFARLLREQLEAVLTPERLALLELYAELRGVLQEQGRPFPTEALRELEGQALDLLRQGRRPEARQLLRQQALSPAERA
jgi:precorrin-2 dehydrogenase/sirohydrochlorin ferrochelatase